MINVVINIYIIIKNRDLNIKLFKFNEKIIKKIKLRGCG